MRPSISITATLLLCTLSPMLSCSRQPARQLQPVVPVTSVADLPKPPDLMFARMEDDGLHVYRNAQLLRVIPLKDWQPLNNYTWLMEFSPDGRTIVAETTRFGGANAEQPFEHASFFPVCDWVMVDLSSGKHLRITSSPRFNSQRWTWMSREGRYWALLETDSLDRDAGVPPMSGTLRLYRLPSGSAVYRRHISRFYGGMWLPGEKFVYRTARTEKRDLRKDPFFVLDASSRKTRSVNSATGARILRKMSPYVRLLQSKLWYVAVPNEMFNVAIAFKRRSPGGEPEKPPRTHLIDLRRLSEITIDVPAANAAVDISPDGTWLLAYSHADSRGSRSGPLCWMHIPTRRRILLDWTESLLSSPAMDYNLQYQILGSRDRRVRDGHLGSLVHMMAP